jgi:hypothetical protein
MNAARSNLEVVLIAIAAVVLVGAVGCTKSPQDRNRVVTVGDNKLTTVNSGAGDQKTYDVAPETQITLDEEPAKLEDLDEGDAVAVMTEDREGERVAMRIVATSREKLDAEPMTPETDLSPPQRQTMPPL